MILQIAVVDIIKDSIIDCVYVMVWYHLLFLKTRAVDFLQHTAEICEQNFGYLGAVNC